MKKKRKLNIWYCIRNKKELKKYLEELKRRKKVTQIFG
jgi:Na+-transporting NADH:ubiquinone oxidoreductase subunit NqrF